MPARFPGSLPAAGFIFPGNAAMTEPSAAAMPASKADKGFGGDPRRLDRIVWIAIVAYTVFHGGLRLYLSSTIAVDDVEQILLTQSLRLGYNFSQPPLHGWLLWLVSQLTGPNLMALVLVKQALLLGILSFAYLSARRLIERPALAVLAVLGLTEIYVIGYGLHRGYTHTAVLTFFCFFTLYAYLLLEQRRRAVFYVFFGLVIGFGLLSKYGYVAALAALIGAVLWDPERRPVLLDRRILLSLAVAALVVTPYLAWVFLQDHDFFDLYRRALNPLSERGFLTTRLIGSWRLLRSIFGFPMPFLILAVLVFPRIFTRKGWDAAFASANFRLLFRIVLIGLVILLLMDVFGGTTNLKGRHMHPFLIMTPLLFFAAIDRLAAAGVFPAAWLLPRVRVFAVLGGILALVSVGGLAIWALRPPPECGKCRFQTPYPGLAAAIGQAGLGEGTLIAGDEFIGGNLRAGIPALRVYSLPYEFYVPPDRAPAPNGRCLIVWDERQGMRVPRKLRGYARAIRGGAWPESLIIQRIEVPFPVRPSRHRAWRYVALPPAGDCY
jgi:hypothetical protein